jgi:hypothetical protein
MDPRQKKEMDNHEGAEEYEYKLVSLIPYL